MPDRTNLAQELKEGLPPELVGFIGKAGELAQKLQQRLYLVGGAVRDLILGQQSLDLDLVTEGDAIKLAKDLAERYSARLTIHNRFGTASLHWGGYRADLASARAETYERPGALPSDRKSVV